MNNFTKMKNIDWNSYKKELDVFVNSKITFLQKFLKKNFFINENKNFIIKYSSFLYQDIILIKNFQIIIMKGEKGKKFYIKVI